MVTEERGNQPRLLLVDDNSELRAIVQISLEELGYLVHVAGDGYQALQIFQNSHVDLVLSDLYLPGISGYTLYAELHKTRPVPVIFMSGSKNLQDVRDALALGASAFLKKPADFTEIAETIRQVLQPTRQKDATRLPRQHP